MDEKLKKEIEETNKKLEKSSAEEVLRWAIDRFSSKIAFASSFGAEDCVVIDMIAKINPKTKIFTLDTGRLPEETYDVMERIREKYKISIEVYFPDRKVVEELETKEGFYSFRKSIEARKYCCGIRKIEPLKRALSGLDAWITGLRREQAVTRGQTGKVEIDAANNLVKVNPLADWKEKEVWDYIKKHNVPYNALHDKNYPSIGCAPCTRAIKPGEDVRAGRWWWELPEQKECGLHKR
jgi:phosphoadenosine phosphosulfate reductase